MTFRILSLIAMAIAGATTLASSALAQDGYRLRAGDSLRIEVLEDPSLNRNVLIAPDGRISVPLAGGIQASGRTLESVQVELSAKLEPNFATRPTVYLALERLKEELPASVQPANEQMISVFVMGEAAKPGKLDLKSGSTVLHAFAQMGGFSKFAATKRIQLRRGSQSWTLDYRVIEAGNSLGNTVLADGDIIVIPQRKLFE